MPEKTITRPTLKGTTADRIRQNYLSLSRAILSLNAAVLERRLAARKKPRDPKKRNLIIAIAEGVVSNCRETIDRGRLLDLADDLELLAKNYSQVDNPEQGIEILDTLKGLLSTMQREADKIKPLLKL